MDKITEYLFGMVIYGKLFIGLLTLFSFLDYDSFNMLFLSNFVLTYELVNVRGMFQK